MLALPHALLDFILNSMKKSTYYYNQPLPDEKKSRPSEWLSDFSKISLMLDGLWVLSQRHSSLLSIHTNVLSMYLNFMHASSLELEVISVFFLSVYKKKSLSCSFMACHH
jgi:hypothetical protein